MIEGMQADFAISADRERSALRISMRGFFGEADVARFRGVLEAELVALGCAANQHVTLCDVSRMKIQPQDIVAAFTKVVGDPRYRSKRLAFITGSSLARMQTRRLTDREGVEFFGDREAAERWLFGEVA